MTGDMLFKQSSTLICWPDGSLAAYLESLERLRATVVERNVARLLTAHGPLIDHPLEAIDRVYRHRLDRLERVRAASEAGIVAAVILRPAPPSRRRSSRACG